MGTSRRRRAIARAASTRQTYVAPDNSIGVSDGCPAGRDGAAKIEQTDRGQPPIISPAPANILRGGGWHALHNRIDSDLGVDIAAWALQIVID